MPEKQTPTGRIAYTGDLLPLVERLAKFYTIGKPTNYTIVEVGYEDCNVIIDTNQGKFLAKMFAKTRTLDEINRYVDIMQKVIEAGIHHPELMKSNDDAIYKDSGVSLVLMRFINGKTFFELDRAPDENERYAIFEQAAKIHAINHEPPYLFDSWAVPNIREMFDKVKQYIESSDKALVERVIDQYTVIPLDELPHSFVHGDLTKANVLKGDDGKIYVLDFSVANRYPRLQELAVIAANLLHTDNTTLEERCRIASDEYSQFSQLTDSERQYLPAYTLAAMAMEFIGAHQEKFIMGNCSDETDYWLNLGRTGLRQALNK